MDKKVIKNIIRIFAGILVVLGIYWVVRCQCVNFKITPAVLRDYIQGFGRGAALVYVLAYALNTISILPPIAVLSLTAGLAFGRGWGAVLLMAGAILGTSSTFFISRLFGRAFIEKIMRGRLSNLDNLLENKGFAAILFFRLIPLVPYEVLNYASGLSKIKFKDYCLATFLGLIPGVVISAFFGGALGEVKGFRDLISLKFMLAFAVLLIIFLTPLIYKHLRRKRDAHSR